LKYISQAIVRVELVIDYHDARIPDGKWREDFRASSASATIHNRPNNKVQHWLLLHTNRSTTVSWITSLYFSHLYLLNGNKVSIRFKSEDKIVYPFSFKFWFANCIRLNNIWITEADCSTFMEPWRSINFVNVIKWNTTSGEQIINLNDQNYSNKENIKCALVERLVCIESSLTNHIVI